MSLGHRLAELRNAAGISQDALALKSGVARNAISSLEKGKGNPTVGTLESLTSALGVPFTSLFMDRKADPPKSTRARTAAAGNAQDLAAGLEFLSAFAKQGKDIQLVAMALVFEDLSYLEQVSPEYRAHLARLSQQLLKALA